MLPVEPKRQSVECSEPSACGRDWYWSGIIYIYWTIKQNDFTRSPSRQYLALNVSHGALQLQWSGFSSRAQQSQRLRWKWLNYKQHFGFSSFFYSIFVFLFFFLGDNIKRISWIQQLAQVSSWRCRRTSDVISSCSTSFSLCCSCGFLFCFCFFVFVLCEKIMSWNCLFLIEFKKKKGKKT